MNKEGTQIMKRTIIINDIPDRTRAATDGTTKQDDGAVEELLGYSAFVHNLAHPKTRPAPTDDDVAEGRDLFVARLQTGGASERTDK